MRVSVYDAQVVDDLLYISGICETNNAPIVIVVMNFYAESSYEMAIKDSTIDNMHVEFCMAMAERFGEDNVDLCHLKSSLYYTDFEERVTRVRSKVSEIPEVRAIARKFQGCRARETEYDHVTKYFVIHKWPRSGIFEIDDHVITTGDDSVERPTLWARVLDTEIRIPDEQNSNAAPLGAYFDIEVFSHDCKSFPSRLRLTDMIYMMSVVLEYNNQRATQRKFCFVVGVPEKQHPDYTIIICQDEIDLIVKFCDYLREWNPDYLSGYNIHNFDIEYIEARLAIYGRRLPNMGRYGMSSFGEARGPRGSKLRTIVAPGRIVFDVYLFVREYTSLTDLSDFTLKSVTKYFLGADEAKIDLEAKEQFRIYKEYILHPEPSPETTELWRIVDYCIRDSDTLPRLFEHCKIWMTIMQLSNTLGSSMQTIESAGQYARLQPLLYAEFRNTGYILHQQNTEDVKYEGGLVECNLPGIHTNGAIVDFKSMYPSIAIAHNLCTSTLVQEFDTAVYIDTPELMELVETYDINCEVVDNGDDNDSNGFAESDIDAIEAGNVQNRVTDATAMPDETGHDDNEQAVASNATITDKDRKRAMQKIEQATKYKKSTMKVMFVKAETREGVLPRCLARLLRERAEFRKIIETLPETETDRIAYYDKVQGARKIAANSIYGILRFLAIQIAMTITALGQKHIRATTNFIVSNFGARHIYTDTDSSMFKVPGITSENLHKYKEIANAVNNAGLFPHPMEVDLEAYILRAVFIAKKNYVAMVQEPGKKPKLKERGVLTRRSDKAKFIKRAYSDILNNIFQRDMTPTEFARLYFVWIRRLFTDPLTFNDFVRTESYRGASAYVNKNAGIASLARRCEEAGLQATPGMRMKHVVTKNVGEESVGVSQRIATLELMQIHGLEIDRMHYFNVSLQHPVEKLYKVIYGELSEEIPRPPGAIGAASLFTGSMFKTFKRMTQEEILSWI